MTTVADIINGDASNPQALSRNPGPDGVSLREALGAATGAPGPDTITFSPTLKGRTIVIASPLYIQGDGVSIGGLLDEQGQPAITLDASGLNTTGNAVIVVLASETVVSNLRFTRVGSRNTAVRIQAGSASNGPPASQSLSNVRIEGNVFDNRGTDMQDHGFGVSVWMGPRSIATGATISHIRIARNSFIHYYPDGDGVFLGPGGSSNTISDVVIEDNSFDQVRFHVELAPNPGSNNRLLRTQVLRNRFANGGVPVFIGTTGIDPERPAAGNVIAETTIWGNRFTGNQDPPITITGGVGNARGNQVLDTRIVNNLMARERNGIAIAGGEQSASTGNLVSGVHIANNTMYPDSTTVIGYAHDWGGAKGNRVEGVRVINTIVGRINVLSPDAVHHCITSQTRFAGINGNLTGDPGFVDPAGGDFRLKASSPAVDRGTVDGAPTTDMECRQRVGLPDIGALEHAGVGGPCPGAGNSSPVPASPRPTAGVRR